MRRSARLRSPPPPTRRSGRRWLLWGGGLLTALLLALGLAGWLALKAIGRTPAEVLRYTEKRLEGHATLELLARPVIGALRWALVEGDEIDLQLPFAVPALPPNPARPGPAASAAEAEDPRIIRVGPKRTLTRIGAAAQLARDGSVIEIDPGDYVADPAIWDLAEVTIRGLGDRVRLIAAGAHAEGKALWVIRRGRVLVENIEFVGARVPDRNGAGIRLEQGHLVVRRCTFWGNENGILTAGEPDTTLEVEHSEFGYNGAGDGQSHNIYVGPIDRFSLRGSYLHHANVGHLLKSRARANRVEYNRLSDEDGGRASYEMEFPNGGLAEVVGNVIQQGTGTRNSVIVSFGAEGYSGLRNELRFVHNTVVNDQDAGGTFLRVAPGAGVVWLRNNLWVGPGKVEASEAVDAAGDRRADWSAFARPSRLDFRIGGKGREPLGAAPLAPVPPALTPRFEYVHPRGTQSLAGAPTLPGAVQSVAP